MGKKSKKKRAEKISSETDRREIHVGGSYIEGNVTARYFAGRDKIVRQDSHDQVNVTYLFEPIYQHIETRPDTSAQEKAEITELVHEIEEETTKGDGADETFLEKHLRNLKAMAGDIFTVVIAALGGPASVIRTVISKIQHRIEAENAEEADAQASL